MEVGKLVVNGSMEAPGGQYEKVSIRGEATVTGAVTTEKVSVYGDATFNNDVRATKITVMGDADFHGEVYADELKVYGDIDCEQKAMVKHCKIRGDMSVEDGLIGEIVNNKGMLKVNGPVSVDRFDSIGGCKIDDLLTADEINLRLYHVPSRIKEIGAGKVSVKRSHIPLDLMSRKGRLIATEIEADEIYLENTTADVVRGGRVQIGPGCNIQLVEYRDFVSISKKASVKEKTQLNVGVTE